MSNERTSVEMQAGAVRHMTANAPDHLRRALEDAAATLDYHAKHPALFKAVAYFLHTAPVLSEFFEANPDVRISAVGKKGELSNHGK